MTTMTNNIFVETVQAASLPMTVSLGALIIFALWTSGRASRRWVLMPLLLSFSAFIISRLLGPAMSTLVFSFLNFVCFAGLSAAVIKLGEKRIRHNDPPAFDTYKRVIRQSAYLAALGVLVFLGVAFKQGGIQHVVAGVINFALIGATARLIAFVFAAAHAGPVTLRPITYAAVGLLSLSWLALQVTPVLTPDLLPVLMTISRVLDIATLVLVLTGLLADYVRISNHLREESAESHAEMKQAKAELAKLSTLASDIYEESSDVIKKQKEQTLQFMKKVSSLEKILEIGITIQQRQKLDEILKMITELVRENIGFNTVILRLLNPRTQNFETEAWVGLNDEERESVVNYRIPIAEYRKMVKPQFRVSKSYFIRNSNSKRHGEDDGAGSMLVNDKDTWGEIDKLIVPLLDDGDETIGYVSVENPENPQLSLADVIETLEQIAVMASIAIRNGRMLKELKDRNLKLSNNADKLSSLNKMKSSFVATVSHEFRTPLTSIKAYCETLLKNADEVDRELLKQFLIVIDEESSRLMSLIDDILDFSQLESGAAKFERKPTDIVAVVSHAADELAKNYEVKQVQLHKDLPSTLVMHIDADLIKQLVVNLLHNAAKFTKENGNVWIKVSEHAGAAHITVEDDGIGIPDTQLGQIFDEFHQADSSNTRRHGGTGLGLAICKNIVESHDGRIWVENVSGRGARFVAVIPKKEVVVKCHVTRVSSIVRGFEIERFLELLVENIAAFLQVNRASIMLLNPEKSELQIECALGLDEEIVENARVKVGEGISGRVATSGRTLLVGDIETDSRTERSNNEIIYGSKAFLSVPIKHEDEVLGVINVASPFGRQRFHDKDARMLEALAARLSTALRKLQTFANASADYERVREAFKSILESRRYIDRTDDELVVRCVMLTAEKLGMPDRQRDRLKFIMNIYDLGLSKVGYHIVKKPHDLSPNDRQEIERHTEVGRDLLRSIETDAEICEIVLRHHENFDGSGYPDHISGNAIPLEARIVRVADTLRALISQRPHQRQYSMEEAMDVIKHRAGSHFDPQVVDAFVESLETVRIVAKEASATRYEER